jgi:hypothetical protein
VRSLALRLLLVVALVAPTHALVPTGAEAAPAAPGVAGRPAVAASASGTGEWVPVAPVAAWGGTGTRLAPGQERTVTLQTGRAVPADAQALVVQVLTTAAAGPGALLLGAPGDPGDASVAFDSGSGSTTTLLVAGADRRALLRTDVDVRVALSVVGYVTGAGDTPAAGATTAVRPARVIDSGTGQGGQVPPPGTPATVPLAGLGGVPTTGVAAVWLAVQTHGTGAGSLRLGDASTVDSARVSTRWTSSLVLAPLTESLDLVYTPTGAALDGLRVTVVGWVADGSHGTSAGGALVPVPARDLQVPASLLGLTRVTLTGGAVPATVSDVAVQATVTTGALPGDLRTAQSLLTLLVVPDAAAPLPARATSTVTAVVPVARDGGVYVAVPAGARITALSVVGYRSREVRGTVDREDPTVSITAPAAGAQIDQATQPVLSITGEASDSGSGVRMVTVAADGTDLGAATLRSSATGRVLWTIDTAVPAGEHRLTATATDWAGRTRTVETTVTVSAAAPEATVVAPEVQVLDEAVPLADVTAEQVVVNGTTAVRAGDVLVQGVTEATPDGLLRRALSVERVGGTTVVRTGPASLTDVFLQVEIHADDVPLGDQAVRVDPATGEVVADRAARALVGHTFSLSGSAANGPVSARLSATVTLSLTVDIDIDTTWSWGVPVPELQEFRLLVGADTTSVVSAAFTTKAESEIEIPLREITFARLVFAVGPVPVVLTPNLDPAFYVKAGTQAASTVSYTTESTFTAGIVYEDGSWEPVSTSTHDGELDGNLTVAVSVGAGLRLPVGVKIYEVAGPFASVELGPELELKADAAAQQTTATLDVIVGLSAGAEVEVFDKKLAEAKFDLAAVKYNLWERTLPWSGSGDFGLADAVLPVCLPTYLDTEHDFRATELGAQRFQLDSRAVDMLTDSEIHATTHLLITAPGSSRADRISVTWDYDPESWYGQHMPESYTSQAANVFDSEGPGVWRVELDYPVVEAIKSGYVRFSVTADRPVTARSILEVRTYINDDQGLCAYRDGVKIADGVPSETGLHWDAFQWDGVQFTLEGALLPVGTDTVRLTCTDSSVEWMGFDVEMERTSGYSRWTTRFGMSDRHADAWIYTRNFYGGAGLQECSARAVDGVDRVLQTYPLVGGTLDAPFRDIVPT